MSRNKISEAVQREVRQQAKYLCEYCHASEKWQYIRFTIDHVIPLSEGGTDCPDNLALACFHFGKEYSSSEHPIKKLGDIHLKKI